MNNMFVRVGIWTAIIIVLLTTFKHFTDRSNATNVEPINYSQFLDEVKSKRIKDVVIEDRSIVATTADGKKVKTGVTYLDRGLVGDLVDNGVQFDVMVPHAASGWSLDLFYASDAGRRKGWRFLVRKIESADDRPEKQYRDFQRCRRL